MDSELTIERKTCNFVNITGDYRYFEIRTNYKTYGHTYRQTTRLTEICSLFECNHSVTKYKYIFYKSA